MAKNVEIKARLSAGQLKRIRETALSHSEVSSAFVQHTDTFFLVNLGRLKLRECGDGTAELIAYDRPDDAGPKVSDYVVYRCVSPKALLTVLERSMGVRGVVRKHREVILIGQTRVHLDEVEELGEFLELEVVLQPGQSAADGEGVAKQLLFMLGVDFDSLIKGAYIDLIEARSA